MTNYLTEATCLLLQQEAVSAEKLGALTPKQLEIIYEHRLFNLFVPKESGGLELDLISGLQLQEQLAAIDGSLGWTVTLVSGANAFYGFYTAEQLEQIYGNPQVCCAGSGAIKGVAREIEGGYRIDGHWDYVTAAAHATIFTANCQIERNGVRLVDEQGAPIYKSFFFLPDEVVVNTDWHTMGMVATSSHSYAVSDLKLSENRSFAINAPAGHSAQLIYRYPFSASAVLTITANHIGMQKHFLELAQPLLQRPTPLGSLNSKAQWSRQIEAEIQGLHREFYRLAQQSWEQLQTAVTVSDELILQIQNHCKHTAKRGRELLMDLYPHLGIAAADRQTELNRVVRDLLTASQHSILL
ncbi:hydroxylase [Flavobacterium sp. JP2137]|uniref:hydroxylase n=1 Tax=Flavobacterium sp. JP2137 TaxID=3414510 RepID=UPI003D2FC4F3